MRIQPRIHSPIESLTPISPSVRQSFSPSVDRSIAGPTNRPTELSNSNSSSTEADGRTEADRCFVVVVVVVCLRLSWSAGRPVGRSAGWPAGSFVRCVALDVFRWCSFSDINPSVSQSVSSIGHVRSLAGRSVGRSGGVSRSFFLSFFLLVCRRCLRVGRRGTEC